MWVAVVDTAVIHISVRHSYIRHIHIYSAIQREQAGRPAS